MINPKTLILLRHGKAENGSSAEGDHARKLAPRGLEASLMMGEYLVKHRLTPQKVLCSNAVRTTQTFAGVQQAFDKPLNVEYTQKLYHASANEMLKIIGAVPEEVDTLLIVGHNPGMHQLTLQLAKEGDDKLIDQLHIKYPTCALAIISLDAPWHDAMITDGILKTFVTPAMLGGAED